MNVPQSGILVDRRIGRPAPDWDAGRRSPPSTAPITGHRAVGRPPAKRSEQADRAPILQLEAVSKSYTVRDGASLEVLRAVDLQVHPGAIHAILGRSGCGKSTLLHLIAGLAPPDSGRIAVRGTDIREFDDWRTVGYVFQDDRLLPWRTALRNVALALEPDRLSRRERLDRAREMLALVGLAGFEHAYPNELSGGMRSRVALARSLVRRPRLLLMDEPFSRLDAQTRTAMHAEIVRLRDLLGMSVLFVTHDVEEAAVLADEITVLAPRPGRVIARIDPGIAPPPRDATAPGAGEVARRLRAALAEPGDDDTRAAVPEPLHYGATR